MDENNNSCYLDLETYPDYVKAIGERDIETVAHYYNDDLVFIFGGLEYDLDATLSFLSSTKKLTRSRFDIHNTIINGDYLKSDSTEIMTVLMDCDLLYLGDAKVGDQWKITYTHHYKLRSRKISEIKAELHSFEKIT